MVGEASSATTSRRFGSYEVVGTIATPRSSDGSTVFIAIARPAKSTAAEPAKLALSFSPSKPNEATKTINRPVVIKRLSSSLTRDKTKLEGFLEAARAATTLRHASVAVVETVGTEGDDVYLVSDYLLGETAASLLRRLQAEGDRLKPPLAAFIAAQVCGALDAGHSAGLVHGRLTPHDIFIDYDGSVHVFDIGVADARTKLADGRISGVELEYASPEVCRNETVDPRTDVFTLGVILWELLSGLSPFERPADADVVRAICDESVVPPKNIVPGLPTELSVITLQALARDRAARFQSAKALRGALDDVIKKYIVGNPADHLAKVMRKVFATREKDKRELVKRVMAGGSVDGLDFTASDRSTAPARPLPPPPNPASARVPAAAPAPAEGAGLPNMAVHTEMTPAKSNAPAADDDQPSVVIKAQPAPPPPVGTMIATLPSGELRLDTEAEAEVLGASPAPPPPVPGMKLGHLLAIIGALVGITIAVVVVGRMSAGPKPAPEAPVATSPSESVAAREAPPPPPEPIASIERTASVTPPEATETTIHIETIPAQASIFIAGDNKGSSPLDLKLAKSDAPITLEIRRAGYATLKEKVTPDMNQRLKLTLAAKPGAKPTPAPSPANPYKKFE